MITPGNIYVLTKGQPALRPNKRKGYDWRAAYMPAGMEFQADLFDDTGVLVIRTLDGGYDVRVDRLPDGFCDLLERVEHPTPSQYMRGEGVLGVAYRVLDALMAEGHFTLTDVKRALNRV